MGYVLKEVICLDTGADKDENLLEYGKITWSILDRR